MANENEAYPEFPVFKGLQKPLEFMGLRGRYIYWAAGTVGGALLSFMIIYITIGFLVAIIAALAIIGVGGAFVMLKQVKGLHSKKVPKGIFVFAHSFEFR